MQPKLSQCGTRSDCPINAVVEIVGDQWTLLILRDMLLQSRARFSEFRLSAESVATNILATRLKHLIRHGLIEKHKDPQDGRGALYLPTDRALDMIPILLAVMSWSQVHQPGTLRYPDAMAFYQTDPHGAADQIRHMALTFRKEMLQ